MATAAPVVLPGELRGRWSRALPGAPSTGDGLLLTSLAETTSEPGLKGAQELGGDRRGQGSRQSVRRGWGNGGRALPRGGGGGS